MGVLKGTYKGKVSFQVKLIFREPFVLLVCDPTVPKTLLTTVIVLGVGTKHY